MVEHADTQSPRRRESVQRNRAAIAAAALDVFTRRGFAAARIEDVAAKAGVSKGTIYLHFPSKGALFEAILAQTILPAVDALATSEPDANEPTRAYLDRLLRALLAKLGAEPGAAVIRLLVAEGPRFPDLARIYFRTVVEPGLAKLRRIGALAAARGEAGAGVLQTHPQLVIAPILMGLLWRGAFDRFDPLDLEALVETQLDLIFDQPRAT